MDNRTKFDIAKMQSLIERMDKHMTLTEARDAKNLLKEEYNIGRVEFNSLDDLINTVDLGKSFVGLAYVQAYEASKVYPGDTSKMDALKGEVNKLDANSRVSGKFNNMFNDAEFSNPTGRAYKGLRTMKNPHFAGILKLTNYVFNWGDSESLAKFYEKQGMDMSNLRRKYGFGYEETSYDDNDWRRNPAYKGLGAMPMGGDKRKNPDGSDVVAPYNQKLNPSASLYGDTDTYGNPRMSTRPDGTSYQKRAFKFGLRDITKEWSDYCVIDMNGQIDAVEKSLADLMHKAPLPADLRKTISSEMAQDEINFINDLSELTKNQAKANKMWLEDNIAYIVATGTNRMTGEKVSCRWVNKNIVIDSVNVDETELKPIIDAECAKAYRKVNK